MMCTHLHSDHVGWNTRLTNGRWVPTFPNAGVRGPRGSRGCSGSLGSRAGRTLLEIHVDVARRWTIDQLARAGGMSRAVFAERVARRMGCRPPYLLEWYVH